MAKTKTPFLSLGASGSIGNALTSQKRGAQTLLRAKPAPAYRYSLPQAYQRWLYEDYAYLWRQQSDVIQRTYAVAGGRHHLTGFQYWMKYHLTNLPDIVGMWYLDEKAGATAHDRANRNNATIFGAVPTSGLIDGSFYFDGLNDYLSVPSNPTLDLTTNLTLECFALKTDTDFNLNFCKNFQIVVNTAPYVLQIQNADHAHFYSFDGGLLFDAIWPVALGNIWYHLAGTFDSSLPNRNAKLYVDGILRATANYALPLPTNTEPLHIGQYFGHYHKGNIDHAVLYNRTCDATEILRHSKRRYPVQ